MAKTPSEPVKGASDLLLNLAQVHRRQTLALEPTTLCAKHGYIYGYPTSHTHSSSRAVSARHEKHEGMASFKNGKET